MIVVSHLAELCKCVGNTRHVGLPKCLIGAVKYGASRLDSPFDSWWIQSVRTFFLCSKVILRLTSD